MKNPIRDFAEPAEPQPSRYGLSPAFVKLRENVSLGMSAALVVLLACWAVLWVTGSLWWILFPPLTWVAALIAAGPFFLLKKVLAKLITVFSFKGKQLRLYDVDVALYQRQLKEFKSKQDQYNKDVAAYEEWTRQTQRDYWFSLDGWTFEKKFADILHRMGLSTQVTRGSGDGGIDIIATDGQKKIVVQCKAHRNRVGPAVAREFYGALLHTGASEGYLVALGGVTKGVFDFLRDKPIRIIDVETLIALHRDGSEVLRQGIGEELMTIQRGPLP